MIESICVPYLSASEEIPTIFKPPLVSGTVIPPPEEGAFQPLVSE